MKNLIVAAGVLVATLLMTACSPFLPQGSGSGGNEIIGALKEIASDPRCGHTDRIQGNLGGMGGNNLSVFLERTCPPESTTTEPLAVRVIPADPAT